MADNKITLRIEALDAYSAVLNQAANQFKGLADQGAAAGDRLSRAFSALGIKSKLDIEAEKARMIAAFDAIKQSGVASADEIKRAHSALQERLKALDESPQKLKSGLAGVGEMLAGLFAIDRIVAFTRASFEASMAVDSITSKLKVMTGTDAGAAKEWQYIRAEAKRLGLDLRQTAESYSTFAVATKGTSMEGRKAQEVFTAMSEAATTLHLPAEQAAGALYQFQQMVSKGKVNMQDLRVASESFPGLMGQIAAALGITTKELMKQMENGELMAADVLPKLAEQLHKTYGQAAEEAATKGRSALNRFNTEIFNIMGAVGQSVAPGLIWLGERFINITKAIIGGWQLVAVQVGYTWDYITAKLDPTISKAATQKRLAEIGAAYDESVSDITKKWGKSQKELSGIEQESAAESARNNQRRRDEARKTGEDLAKVNIEYSKLSGDAEAQVTAELNKQYEDRKKATKDYYDQKKAYSTSNDEEAAWEKIKKAKLLEIERKHAQDIEIVQAQSRERLYSNLKAQAEMEILLVREKVARNQITAQEGEQRITEITVASAKAQYDAKKDVADKYAGIYGRDNDEYKKLLKDQEDAHKAYLSANLEAYKRYADNIKAIDQQIKDFRMSIQQKIADIQQKGMSDSQKYADDQKRFNEAIASATAALSQKDYEAALKYNKQAEELASRLVDKKVEGNSKLVQLDIDLKNKLQEIDLRSSVKLDEQQKKDADRAKAQAEYDQKRAELLKEQAATQEGVQNATSALNTVEQQGVQIMEAKKQENQDALEKLKEIEKMKLDPKTLKVQMDDQAMAAVQSALDKLTAPATKVINVVYRSTGSSGEPSYGDSVPGMATGGWVGGAGFGDTQLRMLDPREFVLSPGPAASLPGGFLDSLNQGRSLADVLASYMPRLNIPTMPAQAPVPMGSIDLNFGGGSYAMQAPIDVLAELQTALRRRQMCHPQ